MATKKIATNIPADVLEEAVKLTGLNQTQTIIEGLKELIARERRLSLLSMKGKIHFSLDVDAARKRKRLD